MHMVTCLVTYFGVFKKPTGVFGKCNTMWDLGVPDPELVSVNCPKLKGTYTRADDIIQKLKISSQNLTDLL